MHDPRWVLSLSLSFIWCAYANVAMAVNVNVNVNIFFAMADDSFLFKIILNIKYSKKYKKTLNFAIRPGHAI